MNAQFKFNLLKTLNNKKQNNEGFTLIELLVVVIIIGVLAAIALPNLLGQVGKARESEAKNAIGSLNRAQQAYHVEKGAFATTLTNLETPINGQHYDFDVSSAAIQLAEGKDNANKGTRDYAGAVAYDTATDKRSYTAVLCRATDAAALKGAEISEVEGGSGDGTTATCGALESIK